MAWYSNFLKAEKPKAEKVGSSSNPGYVSPPIDDVFKAYIPNFLYKPPFGYPLNKNVIQLRNLAKNPYIFSVVRTLKDEAGTAKWEVKPRKEYMDDFRAGKFDEQIKKASKFFYNPNGNDESFSDLLGAWVQDLCEIDAAVGVKVFNRDGSFSQLFARDGGTFLKNCNIYGYMGNKADYVQPMENVYDIRAKTMDITNPQSEGMKMYQTVYGEQAAYFQYGWTGMGLPVPFGKREVMYIMMNMRSDGIYGRAPLEVIYDTILTLIYGQQYNLDNYLNGNLPDGLIHLVGADAETATAFQERIKSKFKFTDALQNERRVGHTFPVYGGPEAKFIPFNISAADMQIIEQQKWFTKLVWAAFGVTPDEMGFTEDSNKAVSQTQAGVHKRKALRPILKRIEYAINNCIMPELDPSGVLEFAFEDYDLDEDMKKYTLYKMQVDIGVKSPEMIAEEEGIDTDKLAEHKEAADKKEMEKAKTMSSFGEKPQVKADGKWVTHNGKHIFIGEHDADKQDNPSANPLHPNSMSKEQACRYGDCEKEANKWTEKNGGDVYSAGSHAIGVREGKVFDHVLGIENMPVDEYTKKVPYQFKLAEKKAYVKADYLKMNLDELIDEHKKLVAILEKDNAQEINAELSKQKKELESYIDKKKSELPVLDSMTSYLQKVENDIIKRLELDGRNIV